MYIKIERERMRKRERRKKKRIFELKKQTAKNFTTFINAANFIKLQLLPVSHFLSKLP